MRILIGFILNNTSSVVVTESNSNVLVYNTTTHNVEVINAENSNISVLINNSNTIAIDIKRIYETMYLDEAGKSIGLVASVYPIYSKDKQVISNSYCVALGKTTKNTYLILDNNFTVFELNTQLLTEWLSKYEILGVSTLEEAKNFKAVAYSKDDIDVAIEGHKKLESTLARSRALNANDTQKVEALLTAMQKVSVIPLCQIFKNSDSAEIRLEHFLEEYNTFTEKEKATWSKAYLFRTMSDQTIKKTASQRLLGVHLVNTCVLSADAFSLCPALRVVLFSGIESLIIKSKAFANTKISSIRLPYGVVSVAPDAFENCKNLKLIYCPRALTQLLKTFNLVSKPEIVEY